MTGPSTGPGRPDANRAFAGRPDAEPRRHRDRAPAAPAVVTAVADRRTGS